MKPDLSYIRALLTEAGKLFFGSGREQVTEKGYADFVTATDLAVQRLIIGRLRADFPDCAILAEESEDRPDGSVPTFVLDPVDGTTNLIRRLAHSCISLGYVEDRRAVLGAVYNPFTGEFFSAERGKGAAKNGVPIHVTRASALRDSLVTVGTSPYRKDNAEANMGMIAEVFYSTLDIRRSGSSALDLCDVADGRTDAFLEAGLSPWDFSAGLLIVEEAGGRVTDWQGRPLDLFSKQNVLATNSRIHDPLLAIAGRVRLKK